MRPLRRVLVVAAALCCCGTGGGAPDVMDAARITDVSITDTPDACTAAEFSCANGVDDDCDGHIDCLDPDCAMLPCAGGAACCDGACADATEDPLNCGACDNVCDAGQVCVDAACCAGMNVCDTCTVWECCNVSVSDASACTMCPACDACGVDAGACTACDAGCAFVAQQCDPRSEPCHCHAMCQ